MLSNDICSDVGTDIIDDLSNDISNDVSTDIINDLSNDIAQSFWVFVSMTLPPPLVTSSTRSSDGAWLGLPWMLLMELLDFGWCMLKIGRWFPCMFVDIISFPVHQVLQLPHKN